MDPLFAYEAPLKQKRKIWPKILVGLVVLGLLGWTGVSLFFKIKFADFQPPFSPPNVVVSPIETKSIRDKIEAVGTTEANNSATITATITETVTAIPAHDGQAIAKGEVIATLNDTAERANVVEAKQTFNRYNKLADMNIVSESQREQGQAQLDVATAALDKRVIRAPFDGVLGLINVHIGDVVSPGTAITTIDNIDPLDIEFTVPENQVGGISIEMPILATTEAYKGEVFNGKITAMDTRIDPNTRALRVKASIPNPDHRLRPGMLMKTNIVQAVRPAMILPEGAILSKGDQKTVLIIGKNDKGKEAAIEKTVTLGAREGGFVEITSGLTEGDKVIVEGQIKAQPNTEIKVVATKSIDELTKNALAFAVPRKRDALEQQTIEQTAPLNNQSPSADAISNDDQPANATDTTKTTETPLRIKP